MLETKVCRYCKSEVPKDAITCKFCTKDIGPGSALKETGQAIQGCGAILTLLITVPIVLFFLFAKSC